MSLSARFANIERGVKATPVVNKAAASIGGQNAKAARQNTMRAKINEKRGMDVEQKQKKRSILPHKKRTKSLLFSFLFPPFP